MHGDFTFKLCVIPLILLVRGIREMYTKKRLDYVAASLIPDTVNSFVLFKPAVLKNPAVFRDDSKIRKNSGYCYPAFRVVRLKWASARCRNPRIQGRTDRIGLLDEFRCLKAIKTRSGSRRLDYLPG